MYTINANRIAGRKAAETRKAARLSQEALADIINTTTNIHVTPHMIGRYERGECGIDEDTVVALAIGLDTALQNIQDGIDPRNGEPPETPRQIHRLGQMEHRIYSDIAAHWHGDTKALAIATACYCALPEDYRLRAIMGIMVEVSGALSAGAISASSLPEGLPYLEDQIGALSQKAGSGR